MRTSIDIDDDIMQAAMDASGIRTKKGVVEQAIREFVATRAAKSLATGEAGTAPASTIKEGRIRVVLPSGWIVEKSIPDRSREAMAALLRHKNLLADDYDPRAPQGGFSYPQASPESCDVVPASGPEAR